MKPQISSIHARQKRMSIRMVAIVVCLIAIVTTAVFGVIERVNVERRFDAIENANQQTAAALEIAVNNTDLFEENYRLTLELLDTMKTMSKNMRKMTTAFKRRFDGSSRFNRRAKFRRHWRQS